MKYKFNNRGIKQQRLFKTFGKFAGTNSCVK